MNPCLTSCEIHVEVPVPQDIIPVQEHGRDMSEGNIFVQVKPLKPYLSPSSAPAPFAVPGSFSPCPQDNARLFPGMTAEQDLWLWLIQTTCKSVIECLKNNSCYNSSEEQTLAFSSVCTDLN